MTYLLYDKIKLEISDDDFNFLCKNRFFTDNPTVEDIRREFTTGTGITLKKEYLWNESSKRFHEYVCELHEIMGI